MKVARPDQRDGRDEYGAEISSAPEPFATPFLTSGRATHEFCGQTDPPSSDGVRFADRQRRVEYGSHFNETNDDSGVQ